MEGHNFLINGPAGSGKSTVISAIVRSLKSLGKAVQLTCSTGIACHVYDSGLEVGVKCIETLIIDECSMISSRTFSSLCEIMSLKNNDYLFGGVQLILCGDFLQLPPIKDILYNDDGSFCFENELFDQLLPHRIQLKQVIRQTDSDFIKAIHEVSLGQDLSMKTLNLCKSLSRNHLDNNAEATMLYATNDKVDDYNRYKILEYEGDLVQYVAEDSGDTKRLARLTVSKTLWLKVGIPVTLLRNLSSQLVNGLRVYNPKLNKNIAVRRQYPVRPAFALTVHKAQGMTLDRVKIDCRGIFQPGQLGVAMSRVKDIERLRITQFSPKVCVPQPQKITDFLSRDVFKDTVADCSCCRLLFRYDLGQKVFGECLDNAAYPNYTHLKTFAIGLLTPVLEEPDFVTTSTAVGEDVVLFETDLNENDDDAFDDDFNQVIQDLDKEKNRIMDFDLPEDFLISDLFESLKIKTVITPFQSKINDILSTISMEHLKIFSISQFVVISKFIEELNIKEPRNVQPKELVKFYENVHIYLTSLDYKVQCVEMFGNDFSDEHMNICYKIHEAIRSYLLKQKALVYKIEKLNTVQRFVDGHSKAKLRYVGGYCVAKLRHKYSKQKNLHRFSTSSESQFSDEKASVAVDVFNYLSEEEQYLKVQSSDQASLKEIERNQNLARSLTHVSDGAFDFFTNICYQCLTLLNGTNVIKHGENIYQFCLTIISSDK
ncbi:PIF1-like protein [Mya arenaria]|uniref:ATP-dependent DNA helicase n=1 Tax=Mya arenaria TaxID=6604 RepID=A0ABY7E0R0_MYAAR|nr:PIF1-like protein [Mya arenaria]